MAATWGGLFKASLLLRPGHDVYRTWQHFLPISLVLVSVCSAVVGPRTSVGALLQACAVFLATFLATGVVFATAIRDWHGTTELWPVGLVVTSGTMGVISLMGHAIGRVVPWVGSSGP